MKWENPVTQLAPDFKFSSTVNSYGDPREGGSVRDGGCHTLRTVNTADKTK